MLRILGLFVSIIICSTSGQSQGCCSGGAGSPIAGGASTGVLQKNQMEISSNYQFVQSNQFFSKAIDTLPLFDNLTSNYLFLRADYGLSEKFTMSIASGYFLSKSLIELGGEDTVSSKGIGDLILFPRYNIYNRTNIKQRSEITLGLGMKIPLGSHTDSNLVFSHPIVGDIYTTSPPTVQATNGSLDVMFYSFFYHSYKKKKLRVFANTLYVRKGFNSYGEKFGDYSSIGIFVGKTFYSKFGVTVQLKAERIGKVEAAKDIDLLAKYNIDKTSTGSKKVFFIPQFSFTHKSFTAYITSEIPLYQYLEGTQVGSQYQFTTGLAYRFYTKKPELLTDESSKDIEIVSPI